MYQQENGWRDPPWEELIDGREIPILPHPGTNHFVIAGNVRLVFGEYLHDSPATVFGGSFALCLTERDIFSPDCAVVCDPDKIRPDGVHGAPDLVVEILSPATYLRDRTYKKDVYERCGVREYWIVTAEER
ncbi:MAG: Uma2 family endonuclease, partial [Oscillibacter sp.]|nr:Uma2 family endonuclease [Oscillibacter sp.]